MHKWEEHHIQEFVYINCCIECGAIKIVILNPLVLNPLNEVYLKGSKFCGNNSIGQNATLPM